MLSLNHFRPIRQGALHTRRLWLWLRYGVRLDPSSSVSLTARFVSGRRGSITVGEKTAIAFKTTILSRDIDGQVKPVHVGANCFVGGGCVILPGVTIGDNCILGAGAVLHEDMPSNTIYLGNPARLVRHEPAILPYGRLPQAVAPKPQDAAQPGSPG